ncbi:NAD(P)/FAD-dependent oxidoreductase [bacterium]|nr:NAD(P)/FAD-dependent oxidoreductase [bacterium]
MFSGAGLGGGSSSNRTISNKNPFDLPNRLWVFLLEKVNISINSTWYSLSKKESNRLLNTLLNDTYEVKGKTTFKEEFVTLLSSSILVRLNTTSQLV